MKVKSLAALLIVLAAVVTNGPSAALAIRGHIANWG